MEHREGSMHSRDAVPVVCSGRRGASRMALPLGERHRGSEHGQQSLSKSLLPRGSGAA